jgi:hypothetical protein
MNKNEDLEFETMLRLDREMDALSDRVKDSTKYYTLVREFLLDQIQLSHNVSWKLFLKSLTLKEHHLDKVIWSLNDQITYPESAFEEMRKLADLCDLIIETIDSDPVKVIESREENPVGFIKILIIIKLYSLALRLYPQEIDEIKFDGITEKSHWVRYAAKCLVYTNSGCESTYSIGYKWTYEKTNELCKGNASAFFIGSICSPAFWVPLTALMFDKLAKKYKLNPRIIELINYSSYKIRGTFFQDAKEIL